MMNSLIYVENQLIVPIGAKLIGSSLITGNKTSGSTGFSWFLAASLEMSEEHCSETRIAELFPEDIFHNVYSKITPQQLTIPDLCDGISNSKFKSADIVSVIGKLHIPDIEIKPYNPFKPPEIIIQDTYTVYGEKCFSAELDMDGFCFPIFFLLNSKEIVCYANNKPVEIVGVLKWSPSYEVAGYAINQILLGAALLLRK